MKTRLPHLPAFRSQLRPRTLGLLALALIAGTSALAAEPNFRDVACDTWVGVDALGRELLTHEQARPPRDDKFVGMFYFLWLGAHTETGPFNISEIITAHPEAMRDGHHPAWGPMGHYHHWGESIFGYYLSDDAGVLRKHAEMLADADIDVVIFDCTNRFTYEKNYKALCEVWTQARADGVPTPDIAFLLPFWADDDTLKRIYKELYEPGLYRDLWFEWEGKPLVMYDPAQVTDPKLRDFFTYRKPIASYFTGPDGPNQWGWLEIHPQHVFRNDAGEAEQMVVGVAQNAVDGRLGALSEPWSRSRSWHEGRLPNRPDMVHYGLNFQEQWERALTVDPKFIFITGWNEWVALRFDKFMEHKAPVVFVDIFSQEASRDIEPMKGGHGDSYYYQLVNNVRRYKGARPQPPAGPKRSIEIDGRFDDWNGVHPEYRDHRGDPARRNHPGWGKAGPYVNATGRNDFVTLKVARDDATICFYAEAAEPITDHRNPEWMMLFLNTDGDLRNGWEGFDFVVNHHQPGAHEAVLARSIGGWNWDRCGRVRYAVEGNRMELAIDRADLKLSPGEPIDLTFKWADHPQCTGDVMTFHVNGDVAPAGRFQYRFHETR